MGSAGSHSQLGMRSMTARTFGLGNRLATATKEMNTPETDKAERMAYAGEYMVPTEVARRLERERDEAKAEAARIDGAYDDATNYYARIIELIEERDHAREQLREARKYLHWIHDLADSTKKWTIRTIAKEGLIKMERTK